MPEAGYIVGQMGQVLDGLQGTPHVRRVLGWGRGQAIAVEEGVPGEEDALARLKVAGVAGVPARPSVGGHLKERLQFAGRILDDGWTVAEHDRADIQVQEPKHRFASPVDVPAEGSDGTR